MRTNVQKVREWFVHELFDRRFVTDKSGVKTIELEGLTFFADEPKIFGTIDDDWNRRELDWYLSQSLNVNDIEAPVPKIWKDCASPKGWINSNYGYLVFGQDNHHQFDKCVTELRKNPFSRRAVMIYTRPTMWFDYNAAGMSDFTCTNVVQYLIRNRQLNSIVQMRSNDMIYGYKGDYAWQKYVLDRLAMTLNVPVGEIMWQVGSAHIYEKHFHLVEEWFNATSES